MSKKVELSNPIEARGDYLGVVDIKINHLSNRLAATSIDYALSVYNIHPESGLSHYKDIQSYHCIDAAKIDFNPQIGNEILTGTTSLKVIDITTDKTVTEFNKGTKAVESLSYVRIELCNMCSLRMEVSVLAEQQMGL